MLRHSSGPSGGRQSRTKWPALASSVARTASAARNSSTLIGLVPSGTVVTRSVRYSMGFSFRSPGFSHFCHRLLRDLCDYRPWLIIPLHTVGQPAFREHFAHMNDDQANAVRAINGLLAVIAGPRSGKMFVLTLLALYTLITECLCLFFHASSCIALPNPNRHT
jgi:hypothetical protein